jgi:hypothetical protein
MTRRHSPRRLAALALPMLFLASAGCDIAMADFKEQQSSRWTKTYELQPGGRFELANVNGKIDVQPSSGNTIEVVAEKTSKAASVEAAKQALERVEIVESVSGGNIRIETRTPRGSGVFGHANTQVRYTVKLPAGADVKLTTVNGGIELTGLTGRLELEATNGGIKATGVSGQVDATTTNGGVEVELASVPANGIKLGCTNGGITLRLPNDAKASISARITNGGIDTGGLQLDTIGESSRRRLEGRLNGGGPRLELEGTNGGIRLIGRE